LSGKVKEKKDILCQAVDFYISAMEEAKVEYWKKTGQKPELLEKEISLARQVRLDLCS
jgi:hypothetical protein